MALYKENLLNTIEDDLAGRNQNWDDLDDLIADFEKHLEEKPSNGVHGMKFMGALVQMSEAQNISSGSFTTLQWGTEVYDTDNIFDPANPTRLTVPAGVSVVRIIANITFASNAAGGRRLQTLKNGAAHSGRLYVAYQAMSGADTRIYAATPPLQVAPGDYFELQAYQDSGSTINILAQTATWFALEVII